MRVQCDDCDHGYIGTGGVYCIAYQEFVEPSTAEQCPDFTR